MAVLRSGPHHFLDGGGELGQLTRDFEWSKTPVGPVERWPQSLRTMIDVILHSQVPMFLWWGSDMIQFYNDAYRPSLGDTGKHPSALGQRGEDCWPEIWPVIKPLIDSVRAGGATWSENQLIPIFRNGAMEDVYWTFGYSPVRDESGNIAGVLVICHETTNQVMAVKKVEESERSLRSIVLNAPVGICIVKSDPVVVVEVVNDLYLDIVGRKREDIEGKLLWEALPEASEKYKPLLDEVFRTGVPYLGKEHQVAFSRNGKEEVVYVDFVYEPLKSDSQRVMVVAIDVTEKVLARKKVEQSEHRYRTLITESTVAIALYIGPDLRIQYVNRIMTGYWGKDSSVVGKTLAEAVPELLGQPFISKLQHVFATGETYYGTEQEAILKVDGQLRPFYFNFIYKALRDSDGAIYGIHHMAMDVTEQVMARKKLEQSEANLRNVILKAPVAMCILQGPKFVVEIANDRMFTLWGKPREELMNMPIFEGLPEVKGQGFEEILEHVYTAEETYTAFAVPVELRREHGIETVYVNFVYEPFRNPDGNISGILAVASDVTEQVKARQKVEELVAERTHELKESNQNLQRSNSELAQFAYIASHDLQEPARKISTFTEMLQRTLSDLDPKSKSLLEKIERASIRMLSLIRDILTYSQLAGDQQEMRPIDLNGVLAGIKNDLELLIDERQAIITSNLLPQITGIPVQINQLFANLISNALKFMPKGRQPVIKILSTPLTADEVTVSHHQIDPNKSYCRVSFHDNGIGFNPTNTSQIFDIFQRLHSRSEYEGTGIGLAMCKKIVQNHQGEIFAESVEGEGSTFHVILPVHNG